MIVVRLKPLPEIREMVARHRRVLVVGCNTCAAVSLAGGEKEVETLVQSLSLASSAGGDGAEFLGDILQRQCEPEFVEKLDLTGYDAVLSMGCGAGVAFIAENTNLPVYPALDTMFIGAAKGLANWQAECSACGSCVLGETAGICPVTRCAKGIMNGPCGGVKDGRCELGDRDCAWVLIHDRLEAQERNDLARTIGEPKDNATKTLCPQWDMTAAKPESKR
jgi:hypothetical protein